MPLFHPQRLPVFRTWSQMALPRNKNELTRHCVLLCKATFKYVVPLVFVNLELFIILQADASSSVIALVMSTVGSVSAAARPARMRAISLVLKHKAVEIVTNGSLVSRLLGEVMLSCKDPSKKTRDAAFDALVSVAKASEIAGVSSVLFLLSLSHTIYSAPCFHLQQVLWWPRALSRNRTLELPN